MFIRIDTDAMLTVVNNIDNRVADLDRARSDINVACYMNHDPVPAVSDATEPVSMPTYTYSAVNLTDVRSCVQAISLLGEELETRRTEAIELNSSGITLTSDGSFGYYLPDPPEGTVDVDAYWAATDTATNVKKHNSEAVSQARADAADLKNGLDGKKSNRSEDEVFESMEGNEDNPVYAVSFTMAYGVDNMLDAPLRAQENEPWSSGSGLVGGLVERLGKVWQTVSTLSEPSDGQPVFTTPGSPSKYCLECAIDEAVREKPYRVTVMDAFLTAEGTVYDTDFLVSLAHKVEDFEGWRNEPDQTGYGGHGNNIHRVGQGSYLLGHTTDPLAAVLHAMGNNPEAAGIYLAPPDTDDPLTGHDETKDDYWVPSRKAQERVERLRGRGWQPLALDGLTAALAAVSSLRAAPAPGDDTDDRASWATANGLTILAQQTISTPEARRNTGVLLGNCGQELNAITHKADIDRPLSTEPYKLAPLTTGGGDKQAITNALAELFHNAASSKEAAYEVGRGVTAYTAARASANAAGSEDRLGTVVDAYDEAADVLDLVRVIDQDAAQGAFDGAQAATQLLSVAPGAGPVFGVANAAVTLSGPAGSSGAAEDAAQSLQAAAYTSLVNAGVIDPPPAGSTFFQPGPNGGGVVVITDKESESSFMDWALDGGGSLEVGERMSKIGSSPQGKVFHSADSFKSRYGGEQW